MKKYKFYYLGFLITLFAISCKKDDPGVDPGNIPFEELTKEQQFDKVTTYIKHFAGKEYRLLTRVVFDENGESTTENPNDCQKDIIIKMPETFSSEQHISQIVPEGASCGITTSTQADIRESNFTNYKWCMQMYKVIVNDKESNSFNGIIIVQPEIDNSDISEYLKIVEPFQEDWNAAQNNPGTVKARTYREYDFVRVH